MSGSLTFTALKNIPEIAPGQSLADIIVAALNTNGQRLVDGDALAVCQKIVSKAENRFVELTSVTPSARAREFAMLCNKDARLVELVLRESASVVRCVKDVLIVRHRLGFVVANAGIDQSNIGGGDERALLLPQDPDHSAAQLRELLRERLGVQLAVVITDSFGRAWRMGVCGTAIGCAGLVALADMRGRADRFGRALRVTQIAVADELAAAATLVMGEADEGWPVVVISGLKQDYLADDVAAAKLVRPLKEDLFQ